MIQVLLFVFISGTVSARSFDAYHVPPGSSVWGYFTPPMLKKPYQLQTPMEAMVDLTNKLGVAILQDHSYSRGNFAFSPYGAASVLVVMYEGARGESANQIHRAVGFPPNIDVVRTGFRNIHRHLRSYFSHEGFLSGISLNKNGSNLKPEYKKILKYYGYDVDSNVQLHDEPEVDQDAKHSTKGTEPTTAAVTTTPQPNTETPPTTTKAMHKEMNSKNETGNSEVKTPEESSTESAEDWDVLPTTTLVTTAGETSPTTEKLTTVDDSELVSTTTGVKEDASVTVEIISTTSEPTTENETEGPTTTETNEMNQMEEEENMKQSTTVFPQDVMEVEEIFESDYNRENKFQKNLDANDKEVKCEDVEGTNARMMETLCKGKKKQRTAGKLTEAETKVPEIQTESDVNKLDNGMLIPQTSQEREKIILEKIVSESSFLALTTEAPGFQTRSGKEFPEETPIRKFSRATDKVALRRVLKPNKKGWERQLRKLFDSKTSLWESEPRKKRKRPRAERQRRTIADYLKWPLNPDLSLQLQNGMYDTHVSRNADMYRSLPRLMFLVDGAIDTPVPMMTYTNVFSYGYIPKLHAKALEFPLDDIRYKLLIVLPMERRGLRQLIYDLSDFSVRDVLKCLQPTRVKAVIPTFMVEGFVILTSSLQKLGIWDVFDPRKANLSGMSVDPELYVRNIEQSVTVVIRNYVEILDIQTRTMAARYLEHEFEATHPFVYFVLDTATNIALMAGQMLDPLNSRIY